MTIRVKCADDADRSAWDSFVSAHEFAEAYHLYAWRHVLERATGNNCHYLCALGDGDSITGVLPLTHLKSRLFGNFLVSIPCFNYCGVIASDNSRRDALLEAAGVLAKELGADHVEYRHRDRAVLDLPLRDDKVAMRLQLPNTDDALWQSFKPKLRAQIRRPSKEGAECVEGGIELLDEFYAVFSRNMRDLGTPVFSKLLFAEMCRQFSDEVRFHIVRLGAEPVAAGATVTYRGEMEIPFASSLRDFNRYSVNMLLYWSVLKAAIQRGCTIFDFGRSTRDTGTYRFKAQWGAQPQHLRWHYWLRQGEELPKLNPQNPKFQLATKLWSRLPIPLANFLGPRIVRHLP